MTETLASPRRLAAGEGPLFLNASWRAERPWGESEDALLPRALCDQAVGTLSRGRGAAPTALVQLPGLARALGLGQVLVKNEGERFGVGSFKALGASHALAVRLAHRLARRLGVAPDPAAILAGAWRDACAGITAAAATDGNHGRALAWAAARIGCRAVIYVPAAISPGRIAALEALGARVIQGNATYDDAVARCAEACRRRRWLEITDTLSPGRHSRTARTTVGLVMAGYALIADELLDALPDAPPTHVLAQGGVGGLAAAVAGRLWQRLGGARTRVVVVEPDRAACLFASAVAGQPTPADGDLDTLMAGLACGSVSVPAWLLLERAACAFLRLPDPAAVDAMRRLAQPLAGDPPLVAGETGAVGLAGLLHLAADPVARALLHLDATSRVLLIVTEGATDPVLYARLTGLPLPPEAGGVNLI